MKQILTYVSPDREFNTEHQMAARIQIDNSLSLGWERDDIILATNFDYEYNGVKSLAVGDGNYCRAHWPATKINVLLDLISTGVIGPGVHWYHDFDCFQLVAFKEGEPELEQADLGLTNYSRMPRLCSASLFFKEGAEDIFTVIKQLVDSRASSSEEMAIPKLPKFMRGRIKHLNITWAFHKFNLRSCMKIVDKPIRAAHFHLTPDKYDFYVRGNNKLGMRLIPDRLVDIFHEHGFRY